MLYRFSIVVRQGLTELERDSVSIAIAEGDTHRRFVRRCVVRLIEINEDEEDSREFVCLVCKWPGCASRCCRCLWKDESESSNDS